MRSNISRLRIIIVAAVAANLFGCALCERHPYGCSAAVAVVATSVALSVSGHSSHTDQPDKSVLPVTCGSGCQQ